ncbi:hypothetical protein H2199_000814 [Coniosporium tulheliwenetii]|uniref:Uncharacterized protein n=1 Tax=Coniosporium tulheliwenetii TaxID=3383036 RepID=A0ACC2ZMX8_9PEZI|nr:hypothetical protein H2199_000814 [Cladosporium sp. JES 115]
MASATGIPDQNPATLERGEDEPLLGRAGDASQQEQKPLAYNLILGTGIIAQAGVLILLNSAGLLLLAQGALILQPTHTPEQKKHGTWAHAIINPTGVLLLLGGLIVIVYNKAAHHGAHFESPHAILGLITYILLLIQAVVGFTQYFVPQLYGGEDNAKAIYKYHRWAGYAIFTLALVTVAAATQTDFNKKVLHISLWAVIAAAVITLAGILPRIKKRKLGL